MVEELLIRFMSFFSKVYESDVGPLLIISDHNSLCLLKFYDPNRPINQIFFEKKNHTKSNEIIDLTINQIEEYFLGSRKVFKIPITYYYGTDFQKKVWNELRTVKYGETRSYLDIANSIGNTKSYRAVGNANNKNPISIIIPCHRIISNSGQLSGYGGGIEKKKFLLNLELKS